MKIIQKDNVFKNGSAWLKADFHLHTMADKEFKYNGDDNYFTGTYVQKLKDTDTQIGLITNHNKFDVKDFKELGRNALKENIYLIAGVEFSLKEGIHILIAFEEEWYKQENHIQSF